MVLTIFNLTSQGTSAAQFCNTTPIVGPGGTGPANVYPSTINVSGMSGTITDVNVTLLDVRTRGDNNTPPQHWIEDADIMVSAPDNTNVILMSDAGGDNNETSGPVVDADLTFDDQASTQLPADTGPLVSGTYRPVDDDVDADEASPVDAWPAPAPAPSNSTSLSTFNGREANGNWNLWLVDDTVQAGVTIGGGWCIDILTTSGGGGTTTTTSSTTSTTMQPTTTTSTTMQPTTTTSTTLQPTTTTSTTLQPTTTTSTTLQPTTTTSTTLLPTTTTSTTPLPTTTTSTTLLPTTTTSTTLLPTTTTTVVVPPISIRDILCPLLQQLAANEFFRPFISPLLVAFGCSTGL